MFSFMLKNVVGFQKSQALCWNRCFGLKTDLPLSHFQDLMDLSDDDAPGVPGVPATSSALTLRGSLTARHTFFATTTGCG